jgi:hypothetical protein
VPPGRKCKNQHLDQAKHANMNCLLEVDIVIVFGVFLTRSLMAVAVEARFDALFIPINSVILQDIRRGRGRSIKGNSQLARLERRADGGRKPLVHEPEFHPLYL